MRIRDRSEIERLISSNYKKFVSSEYYFTKDSRLVNPEFSTASLRVLTVFLSNGQFRSNSNTFNALDGILKDTFTNIFHDCCYYPYYTDSEILDELNLPYIFGNCSYAPASEYDLVLISISVVKEMFNLPPMLNCSDIPVYTRDRQESFPLMLLGGSAAIASSALYGNDSLVDGVVFGKAEGVLDSIVHCLSKAGKSRNDNITRLSINKDVKEYLLIPSDINITYKSQDSHLIESIIHKDNLSTVKYNWDRYSQGFSNRILNLDGSFVSSSDLLISSGCTGHGACSFCLEGNVSGPWVEKDCIELEKDLKKSITNNVSENISIYSYNSNYYSKLPDLVDLCTEYSNRVSLIASRADVYANNDSFLSAIRKLGAVKISLAVEGVSDRLRNQFLNKNLDRSTMYKAMSNVLSQGFLTVKVNYILTGNELEEDYDEWLEDLRYLVDLKNTLESKAQINITVTNLVIYEQTPLRYEPRRMSQESLNYNESEFIQSYLKRLALIKEMGIGISINGSFYSTCIDQLLMDLGGAGTKCLVDASIVDGVRYQRDVSKNDSIKYMSRVRESFDIEKVFEGRSIDSLFYTDIVEHTSKQVIEGYKNKHIEGDYTTSICRTDLSSCVSCRDDCKPVPSWEVSSTCYDSIDKKMKSRKKSNVGLRIVIDRKEKQSYVSPEVQSRIAMGDMLNLLYKRDGDIRYLKLCASESSSSLNWVVGSGLKPYYSGRFSTDFSFCDKLTNNDIEYLKSMLPSLNSTYDSFKVSSIFIPDTHIHYNGWNVYVGTVSLSDPNEFVRRYSKEFMNKSKIIIKVKDIRKNIKLMTKEVEVEDTDVVMFYQKNGKSLNIAIKCRAFISPYLLIKKMFPRKLMSDIYSQCSLSLVGSFMSMKGGLKCFKCNKGEDLYYDAYKNNVSTMCLSCYAKTYLHLLSRK